MPRFKPLPPLERVKELLDYNPATGVFTWKVTRCSTAQAGEEAGYFTSGGLYRALRIEGSAYLAHRVAWLYFYGEDPLEKDVDHKDCNSLNNAISNLRLATRRQNLWNSKGVRSEKSPYKGVYFQKHDGRWNAAIQHNGKKCHIGSYPTPEEASKAYREKAIELRGSFARFE